MLYIAALYSIAVNMSIFLVLLKNLYQLSLIGYYLSFANTCSCCFIKLLSPWCLLFCPCLLCWYFSHSLQIFQRRAVISVVLFYIISIARVKLKFYFISTLFSTYVINYSAYSSIVCLALLSSVLVCLVMQLIKSICYTHFCRRHTSPHYFTFTTVNRSFHSF